jgi:hypothetical protein
MGKKQMMALEAVRVASGVGGNKGQLPTDKKKDMPPDVDGFILPFQSNRQREPPLAHC